jgi:hypothetical protein
MFFSAAEQLLGGVERMQMLVVRIQMQFVSFQSFLVGEIDISNHHTASSGLNLSQSSQTLIRLLHVNLDEPLTSKRQTQRLSDRRLVSSCG